MELQSAREFHKCQASALENCICMRTLYDKKNCDAEKKCRANFRALFLFYFFSFITRSFLNIYFRKSSRCFDFYHPVCVFQRRICEIILLFIATLTYNCIKRLFADCIDGNKISNILSTWQKQIYFE